MILALENAIELEIPKTFDKGAIFEKLIANHHRGVPRCYPPLQPTPITSPGKFLCPVPEDGII